jgi:hypothetical protein
MGKWGVLVLVCGLAIAACGEKETNGKQTGDQISESDCATFRCDASAGVQQVTADGAFKCMCSECFPGCELAELEADAWQFPEECPGAPQWHLEWCQEAQCGIVTGKCQLNGPEPIVDRQSFDTDVTTRHDGSRACPDEPCGEGDIKCAYAGHGERLCIVGIEGCWGWGKSLECAEGTVCEGMSAGRR